MKQLRIKEEIGAIVKLITEAEYTFCCLQEGHEPEMQYIYYDKSKAMHMTNEEGYIWLLGIAISSNNSLLCCVSGIQGCWLSVK